jgi:hypothetical protein
MVIALTFVGEGKESDEEEKVETIFDVFVLLFFCDKMKKWGSKP